MPPVSARDKELLEMPSIASQMPVIFPNGAQWCELECECKGCGKALPENLVRGAVVRQNEHMASIEASGVCHECRLLTRYCYRLHDDMRRTWGGYRPTLIQRLKSVGQLFFDNK